MHSKLSRFCLGVMEAAWLAAVCIIPIFFDTYSSRIFEPDKITILRSLAILTLVAWTIKLVEEGGIKWRSQAGDKSLFSYLLHYPMIAPVIGIVVVYSISTIFSVTPSISFYGSYQRLQGTYTTFSYLVIFLSIIANLRKREQINRLITTVIFASLPVSLYGLLQHYNIDPIPWGGNVSIRIASDLGNSIFVAAYLIMVFPLVVGRIVESFRAILAVNDENASSIKTTKQIIRGTIYVIIGALDLVAIYMSGSRGPLLGLMAGLYFLLLLLSIYWRKRLLTFSVIGVAILGALFLVVFNINNGPLEALKKSPAIGRFGNLLNPESNSALVRQYIWEGTVKLVGIHDPLKFPNGSTDKFNFLRPIIGYGPETMYVAYNQFYQPQLGQVEKRNASPDRAHNETWDSIVITGIAGLLVYLSVFGSVFFYGLKWLELISSRRDKLFFFICLIGGGIVGTIALTISKGIEFLGVGLPFGMVIGVVLYLTIYALITPAQVGEQIKKNPYSVLMIVLFSAIIGHFIEINFGIAIVATRTLFWTYAGLILVTGFVLPKISIEENQVLSPEAISEPSTKAVLKKRDKSSLRARRRLERSRRPFIGNQPDWIRNSLIGAILIGIILTTLGYNYVTQTNRSTSPFYILASSFTRLDNKGDALSFGILGLILLTWIIGNLLFAAETDDTQDNRSWLISLGWMSGISLAIGLIYWLLHSTSLASIAGMAPKNTNEVLTQINSIGALLTKYYIYVFIIIGTIAYFVTSDWPVRKAGGSYLGTILIPVALIGVFALTNISNLKVIHADITFKMAEPFTKSDQWEVATFLYEQALKQAPKEDHYYLFIGKSYMEQADNSSVTADQDKLVVDAEKDLKVAQSLNPLNTDHTANLARLYGWWASKATTNATYADRVQKSSDYYATAVTLSPNNSTLWDEWGRLFITLNKQPQEAMSRFQHALNLDPTYNFTQGLIGDYYSYIASTTTDTSAKKQALETAAQYYRKAADVTKYTDANPKSSYLKELYTAYVQISEIDPTSIDRGLIQKEIDVLLEAIKAGLGSTDLYSAQKGLAQLYLKLGDKANAQYYANQALSIAPSSEINTIQNIITQTQFLP